MGNGDASDHQQLSYPLAFSEDDFRRSRSYDYDLILLKKGGLTERIGWPTLPFAIRYFVLPNGAKDINVTIESASWRALPDKYTLLPAQPLRPAAETLETKKGLPLPPMETIEYVDVAGFQAMNSQVAHLDEIALIDAEVSAVDYYADRCVAAIRIHPLRYRPKEGVIHYLESGTLGISYRISELPVEPRSKSPLRINAEIKKLISLVANPEDLKIKIAKDIVGFDDIKPVSPTEPTFHASRAVYTHYPVVENDRLFLPAEVLMKAAQGDWPYLIITDNYEWDEAGTKGGYIDDLAEEFEELARWKTMKGLRARVITVSDIMANRFGSHWQTGVTRGVPEAIRNFLKNALRRWNTQWCLLGGDINIVPVRHILGNINWFYIEKKNNATPDENKMYYDSGMPSLRYHSPFEFSTADVFFAVDNTDVIRYRANATTSNPGWYWTLADYTTTSVNPTRHITIRGGSALLSCTFTVPQYANMIPTDLYYASIDSPLYSQTGLHDWDSDDNGFYGWWDGGNPDGIDFTADISVGRAPVRDRQQAKDYVDKVLTYEQFRDRRTDNPLAFIQPRRLFCVAGTWGSGWHDGSFDKIRWANLDGACQDKENVIDLMRDITEVDVIKRFYEDIYFVNQIESNLSVNDVAHIADLKSAVNEGPHFLSVSGHGWWDGTAGFSSTDPNWVNVAGMNNWPHFSIYFVDSCLTNEFDLDLWTDYNRIGGAQAGKPHEVCFGKKVVRWGGGGAIGYVGYARMGAVGWSQELPFWEALSLPGQAHLGSMLDHAREVGKDLVGKWQIYLMSLMGDPELPLYRETPEMMTVSHCSIVYGRDDLVVRVFHEQKALTNVHVSITQLSDSDPNDKFVFRQVWATSGYYAFETREAHPGKLNIVVTSENFVPYIGEAQKVSEPVSPWKYRISRGYVYDIVKMSAGSFCASASNALIAFKTDAYNPDWFHSHGGTIQDLTADANGRVIAGVRTKGSKNLILYNRQGTELRSWTLPEEVFSIDWDLNANIAYAGMRDVGVHSVHTETGASYWDRSDLGTCNYVKLHGDYLYATTTDNGIKLTRLQKTNGNTNWAYDVGPSWEWGIVAMCVSQDGKVFAASRNRELHATDENGNQIWKVTGMSASAISLVSYGDTLFVGLGDGQLIRYDRTSGAIDWQRDIGDRIECILAEGTGTLYVGSWHGVFALDPATGNTRWFRETLGAVTCLTMIGNDLMAGARDGWVYAIDTRAYIGNSRTKELHLKDCEWVDLMANHNKVSFSSIEEAIRQGYNGCYYCLNDYDTG